MRELAFLFLAALPVQAGDSLEVRVDRLVHARARRWWGCRSVSRKATRCF
ncbi:MAG: hypothetical protein ACYTDU_09490 [Planctomycetota bacterium]